VSQIPHLKMGVNENRSEGNNFHVPRGVAGDEGFPHRVGVPLARLQTSVQSLESPDCGLQTPDSGLRTISSIEKTAIGGPDAEAPVSPLRLAMGMDEGLV